MQPISLHLHSLAALLPALRGPAASILLALLIAGEPVEARWLAEATGLSPHSITSGLRVLEGLGLAQRTSARSGWTTSPALGVLSAQPPEEAASGDDLPADAFRDSTDSKTAEEPLTDSSIDSSPAELTAQAQTAAPSGPPELGRIFSAAEALFGEPVLVPRGPPPQPALLLALIAQAYAQRAKLRTPARVVHAHLKHGWQPARKYRQQPLAHLPASFLAEAGLAPPAAEPPEDEPEDKDSPPAAPEPPAPHPSVDLPCAQGGSLSASQAWESAAAALAAQLPHPVARRYLAPLRLVRFEQQACRFTLVAPDEASREWVQSRLAKQIGRALSGACGRQAQVEAVFM